MSDGVMRKITVPDENERQRALDPERSFIVQAPAGSGKTELLMQRFLSLLATVDDPGEILAITFTRKAAGEMSCRILESLRKARGKKTPESENERRSIELAVKALERDKSLGWDILGNPSRLRVMTIDSLSASIARQMPLLSRLTAGPTVTESPEELYSEAARRTIEMAESPTPEGEAVRIALRHFDNSVWALSNRIIVMLGKRDQWLRHVTSGMADSELRSTLEGSIINMVETELGDASRTFPANLTDTLVTTARFAANNLKEMEKKTPITGLIDLKAKPGHSVTDLPYWRGIAALLLTSSKELRKPGGVNVRLGFPNAKTGESATAKEAFKGLLEELTGHRDFLAALGRVPELPDPIYKDEDWEVLDSLLRVLPAAVVRLEEVFADTGTVDFQAVASSAVEALGGDLDPTELMLAIDMRLRHILIDEYQDTSRTQLRLIEALTSGWETGDGRTLFIVGDPMQSIYLFREAEVGLFLEARAIGIGNIRLTPLALRANFRSQERIVSWVNDSFREAFPTTEDRFTGAVTYSLSEAVKAEVERLDPDVRIFVERDDDREARDIVEIIKNLPLDDSKAILVRSRPHLGAIIRAFKSEGIEFKSREIDPLEERPVVQDLFSILRALTHPNDRVAWLGLLRAPFTGLTLADLLALTAGDPESPVWALLNDPQRLGRLTEDGRNRSGRFIEATSKALRWRGRLSVRHLVEGLWIDLGGPACLGDTSEVKDAEVFLDLIDSVSVAGSVESIAALGKRLQCLYASPQPAPIGAVEVMTIHKAKGLEFDHVLLPGLGKRPGTSTREIMLWVERGRDLLLAPIEKRTGKAENAIYRYIKGINRLKEEMEKSRLLYVAATRAKKSLHLFGHVKENSGGEIRAEGNSLLNSLAHMDLKPLLTCESAHEGRLPLEEAAAPGLRRLASGWTPPEPAPAVQIESPVKVSTAEEASPEFLWAGPAIKHRGTVVHRYLCAIAKEGLGGWDPVRIEAEKHNIRNMLRALGLNFSDASTQAGEAVRILTAAVTDPMGRWALDAHTEGGVEVPLTAIMDGKAVHVKIDRTFVDEKGARWVIDYKTGTHEGGGVKDFLAREKDRYRPQLVRYAHALKANGEGREIKMGLYYPAHAAFMEID